MEQLLNVQGKIITTFEVSPEKVFIETQCGETFTVLAKELEGWIEFSLDQAQRTILELKEKIITKVTIRSEYVLFYTTQTRYFVFFIHGIQKVVNIHKSQNGSELLLEVLTTTNEEETLHYVKHQNKWALAEFHQETNVRNLEIVRKYDIVNHPSIRIKTLV